jgi:Flavin-binding monooxygenase-like
MANVPVPGKYCVIGAGAVGLPASKALAEAGINHDVLEAQSDLGGTWNINTGAGLVYATTHLISSRRFTVYEDYPIDETKGPYNPYPHHSAVLGYLREYADKFGITPRIQFGKRVERMVPEGPGDWRVQVAGEPEPRRYAGVVVASGHHTVPRIPQVPGTFNGTIMHSKDYKHPDQLRGKRIVVVGGGNSACDIVVDGSHHGQSVTISLRRGYWFLPKFILGWPTGGAMEYIEGLPLPRWLKTRFYETTHTILSGHADRYGLPRPDYRMDQSHPTMGDDVVRLAAHGRIGIKPGVERFDGNTVVFTDGTSVEADMVAYGTGYEVAFPFLDRSLVLNDDGRSRLFMNAFHPERDDFFMLGLVQANGSAWRIGDWQARIVARYLQARANGEQGAKWFSALKAGPQAKVTNGSGFVKSDRHLFEANYFDYLFALKKLRGRFDKPAMKVVVQGVVPAPAADAVAVEFRKSEAA